MKFRLNVDSISYNQKVKIFSEDYLRCCLFIAKLDTVKDPFTKGLLFRFVYSSQILEDFLDFHGAKNNTDWYFYRELASSVRHISLSCFSQVHILSRLGFYKLPDTDLFESQGVDTLLFLKSTLKKLAPAILEEASRLGIFIPSEKYTMSDFPGVPSSEMLPYDISDDNPGQQREHIVKIAGEFLTIASNFEPLEFYKPYSTKDLYSVVPDKVNEVEIRRFEMMVHNLQSYFDTYVIHGGYRFGNRELKEFRSFFSVIFHLLELMGRLLHFYERHLRIHGYKNIYKKVQDRLSELIEPDKLLDKAVNYGLFNVCKYLSKGKDLAKEILNENIERSTITVPIPMNMGFHTRPSLLVAKIVNHYGGKVELCIGEDRFDASSILNIQWAGGKISKENIKKVVFEGDVRALKDIEILAGFNYGEDTMGKGIPLPSELNYLK